MLLSKEELHIRLGSDPSKFNDALGGSSFDSQWTALQELIDCEDDVHLARTTADRHCAVREMADESLIKIAFPVFCIWRCARFGHCFNMVVIDIWKETTSGRTNASPKLNSACKLSHWGMKRANECHSGNFPLWEARFNPKL